MNEIPDQPWLRDALCEIANESDGGLNVARARSTARANASHRVRRRVQRIAAVGAAAMASFVVVAAYLPGRDRGARPVEIVDSTDRSVAPSTSKPVTNTGSFQPVSASFVTPWDGWVLGVDGTCDECPAVMQRTNDGGRTWQHVSAPAQTYYPSGDPSPGGDATVRFSNTTDGYLAVAGKLWSTVDAGLSWAPVVFPGSTRLDPAIWALAVTDTNVIVVTGTQGHLSLRVESANLGATDWEVVGELPFHSPAPQVLITRAGADAWVGLNDRVTSEAGFRLHAGRWQRWSVPCAKQGLTASIAAASEMNLYAGC